MKGNLKYKGDYVCDSTFNDDAALEVCTQMGFNTSNGYKVGLDMQTSTFSISEIVCNSNGCVYIPGPHCASGSGVEVECNNDFGFENEETR